MKTSTAGHGPRKSIEKYEIKFRRGDASKWNKKKKVAEFTLGEPVVTSSGHTKKSRKLI